MDRDKRKVQRNITKKAYNLKIINQLMKQTSKAKNNVSID